MTTFRLIVGLLWLLLILQGISVWTGRATVPYPASMRDYATAVSEEVMKGREPFVEPRVDLYGNEISDAVGDYRVDPRGELYERHAPDTAVLKLGEPGV